MGVDIWPASGLHVGVVHLSLCYDRIHNGLLLILLLQLFPEGLLATFLDDFSLELVSWLTIAVIDVHLLVQLL